MAKFSSSPEGKSRKAVASRLGKTLGDIRQGRVLLVAVSVEVYLALRVNDLLGLASFPSQQQQLPCRQVKSRRVQSQHCGSPPRSDPDSRTRLAAAFSIEEDPGAWRLGCRLELGLWAVSGFALQLHVGSCKLQVVLRCLTAYCLAWLRTIPIMDVVGHFTGCDARMERTSFEASAVIMLLLQFQPFVSHWFVVAVAQKSC